ncbi:hypothetical protein [Sinomicrobium soli]|uniref:hypothetical protein n=1 Tax=Sinomicrobium sp. N-1-3-6 TaxID=2219864 RepID=UPI000DCD7BD3|nr:hypothetical protein [Sinomicrobium sp. N-1-3-6]RAV30758.1 hypothetical protein DN748_00420 [Sinomicrobium sp. N-1-3-6]
MPIRVKTRISIDGQELQKFSGVYLGQSVLEDHKFAIEEFAEDEANDRNEVYLKKLKANQPL